MRMLNGIMRLEKTGGCFRSFPLPDVTTARASKGMEARLKSQIALTAV